jgi:hypothetical protein
MSVDVSQFNAACRSIATYSGAALPEVVLNETAQIMNAAMQLTDVAPAKSIREGVIRSFNRYAGGDFSAAANGKTPGIHITRRGTRAWWIDRNNKGKRTFYLMNGNRRWSPDRWSQYRAEERDRRSDLVVETKERTGRRGIAKQSWHFLVEKIGGVSKAPGYVKKAKVKGQQLISNISALITRTRDGITISGSNAQPGAVKQDAESRILARAVNRRIRFFEKNLKKGVFEKLANLARAYPGLSFTR